MPLIALWDSNQETILELSIEQLLATAGDGRLGDDTVCSRELRHFFSEVESEKLAEYADQCLTHRFDNNGKVLQDIANELGRRLDYEVVNGRYQGTRNSVGNDGLWRSPEGHTLLIEVKTTDAYSMSVDTIANYRDSLLSSAEIVGRNSMLLVVGRYDTGQMEAQVRGSRHAWDMRLISVDSLINLVRLKESTEDALTAEKIRSVLIPMEYTRLDRLVDVMFTTAQDVEAAVENDSRSEMDSSDEVESRGPFEFTERAVIDSLRANILRAIEKSRGIKLIKKSKALYSTSDRSVGVVCTVSKFYDKTVKYWYAHHTPWQQFLDKTNSGFLALGCVDQKFAFVIPSEVMGEKLPHLNTTTRNGKTYWHIHIQRPDPDRYRMFVPKTGEHLDLTPFMMEIEKL
jgi:hypothetical protein